MAPPAQTDIPSLCYRTRSLSIWEGSLWAVMWGLGESYIAPFALFLGAGNLIMAFIGTGPVLITALAQVTGASLLDRVGRRKPIILTGIWIQTFAFLPLFALPVFLHAGGMAALMVCVAFYFFFSGVSAPPWMSLMGDVVDESDRGRYFANRTRIIMYVMVFSMLLAGIIANNWKAAGQTATGFGFLFGIAAFARLTSIISMKSHYDAPLDRNTADGSFSFGTFLRGARKSNFGRFTFAIALMNGTTNIAGPFFSVYMLRDLQWSYLQFTASMLTFFISQTLFVRWWGAISDRHGNRSVLVATGCLLPLLPMIWAFSTNYAVLIFAQIASGAIWSGFNLAAMNFIYDSVPQTRRARALSYYSLINGCFSVLGGMLIGAWIANHAPSELRLGMLHISLRSSLPVVFLASALARALAAAIMLPQFSEVRDIEPISTVRLLWRLGIGQPLFGQVGEFMPRLQTLLPPKRHHK